MLFKFFVYKFKFIVIFLLTYNFLFSYDNEIKFDFNKLKYGIYFNLNTNFYNSNFSKLENFPLCCQKFNSGFGSGYSFGFLTKYDLFDKFQAELRFGILNTSANFEEKDYLYLGLDDYPIYGNIKYTIESNFYSLSLMPIINYNFFNNLYLKSGFNFSILLDNSYYQSEDLSNGLFKDTHLPYRNRYNSELNNLSSINLSWVIGTSYEYQPKFDSNLIINPEILFSLPLNSLHNDVDLLSYGLSFGFNLTYKIDFPKATRYDYQNIYKIDTIDVLSYQIKDTTIKLGFETVSIDTTFEKDANYYLITNKISRTDTMYIPKKSNLTVTVKAVGVDDSSEYEDFNMVIRQVSYFNMTPLLTYIFFDYNTSKIPERYRLLTKEEVENFRIENLYNLSTLELYQQIFNIIGYRMRKYPDASITLTGCNTDVGEEKFNLILSKERANVIKDYLVKVWGIPEERISLKARNLPKIYSFRNTEEGKQENQRVEIYSDKYELIEPIIINDTIRTTSPNIIRFYVNTLRDTLITNWNLYAFQENDTLKKFSGYSDPPKYIDWNIDFEKNTIPKFNTPLNYYAEIYDVLGNKSQSNLGKIDLTQKKIEKSLNVVGENVVEKFSLILFDFDDTSLSQYNERIKNYINSRLSPNSKVYISGYTDNLGDDNYNLTLSDKRAKELAKSLGIDEKNARGFGESVLLYDNSLPEGRFYCRTVQVIVETPVRTNNGK